MNNTKFYRLLLKARYDETSLVLVINKIMPMINKYAQDNKKEIDDDLRSILIEYAIKVIKDENFADKLAKTIEKRKNLLKLLSMNMYDMEENSRIEELIKFKKAYGK